MKYRNIVVGLVTILFGLIAGAVLMALTGNNPLLGFLYIFQGGLKNPERICNTLATATPLILTGLSVAFAFRTGLFNIGAHGQMLMGGLVATMLALSLHLPKPLMLVIIVSGAGLGGALWAWLPGFMKARFNVHEVVSTIMMNNIANWVVYYTIPAYFKGDQETQSLPIPEYASLKLSWLTHLTNGSYVNLGLLISLAMVVVMAIILRNTTLGYELKAVGFNRHAAEYGGINVNRSIIISMMSAGALAGLAGATFYVGYSSNMSIEHYPSFGMDGIAVALLGANSPVGVLGASVFFAILQYGKGFMSAMTKIPPEIGDTIIAAIIYFAATSVLIDRIIGHLTGKRKIFMAKGGKG